MAWHLLNFHHKNDGADDERSMKTHVVHTDLMHPLIHELDKIRGYRLKRTRICDEMWMDHGGACIVTAPKVTIDDLGFKWETWCDEVGEFHNRLSRMPERAFKGGLTYFKMHSRYSALVLTPMQRDIMLEALKRAEPKALDDHEAFMKIWRVRNVDEPKKTFDAEAAD